MSLSQKLPQIPVGAELTSSALGYGAMAVAGAYGEVDQTEALGVLNDTVDLGITMIDTANVYGFGENEKLVGQLLRDRRDEVLLATKFGIENPGSYTQGAMSVNNDPASAAVALNASLQRLGVDSVDLYYLHRRDPQVPIEDVVGAMAELVKAGKVRALGLSEVTATEIRAAHAVHPISAIQSEWSIFSRDVEERVIPAVQEIGATFVAYSPLSRGLLTGTVTDASQVAGDWRGTLTRFSDDVLGRNLTLVDQITRIAAAHEATPAQVALAWLRIQAEARSLRAIPIPGSRRTERMVENIGSLQLNLTTDDLNTLATLAERVSGPRSDHTDPNWVSDTREG